MKETGYQDFPELETWQMARALKIEIYNLIKKFPLAEKYLLTSQIIRSVRSINSNIAEGRGRYTYREQLHFCIQARGSLSETLNYLFDALDCRYVSEEEIKYYSGKIEILGKLLNGYISFLRNKI
jgi:four helix bundle protein